MLVFLALGDAKLLSFASGDAKVPDARYFAFWWNIGFTLFRECLGILRTDSCDERRVYKREHISGSKGGTYMFNTSPRSSDFCLFRDVW